VEPIAAGLMEFLEGGIITHERMRVVDRNAIGLGITALQMMEGAGKALAQAASAGPHDRILILCGKGNNGGDGMAAARHLQREAEVGVCYVDEPGMSPACAAQLRGLQACRVEIFPVRCADDVKAVFRSFAGPDLIIDALLGTGTYGPLREPIASCVRLANESGVPLLSVDVPTPGLWAGRICAFHRPKVAGSEVAEIGIPIEAEIFTGPGELTLVPVRPPDAHKGAGGTVLVVGGGPYQGAPYLAGLGALRAGADIVRIASPVFEPVPDLIYEKLDGTRIGDEHLERLVALAGKADAVVCGNGLGDKSHHVVLGIAPHCRRAVFDADALRTPLPVAEETVYTPHAGEFARMTGQAPPEGLDARGRSVRAAASGRVILLKGATDVISDGNRVRFNRTGTQAMTVGGTGDVLAGMTAALLCHLPGFEAACVAAYANGCAGAAAAAGRHAGLLATDVAAMIPGILYPKD
jgi:hydroxyethylthiazole kinase-like uncharacterized protein yjeF